MRRLLLVAALAAVSVPVALAKGAFPEVIALPNGWQPEGIAIGNGSTFYVGSIPTGAIFRGDVRTGEGAPYIDGATGRAAVGIEFNRGRLYVAGGNTGKGFVYDARTKALLAEFQLAPPNSGATFINDVDVTRRGSFWTDSNRAVVYRVPPGPNAAVQTIQLTGEFQLAPGFNLNGIDGPNDSRFLISVQTATGTLFRIDSRTGDSRKIDVGTTTFTNGDGLLLVGRTLYVVQNQLNRIAVVRLSHNLTTGKVLKFLTDPDLDVPTTLARHGKRLYAVNARFSTPPSPTTTYSVVLVKQ